MAVLAKLTASEADGFRRSVGRKMWFVVHVRGPEERESDC
jgi:hypothetical protein